MRLSRTRALAALVIVPGLLVGVPGPVAAAVEEDYECSGIDASTDDVYETDAESIPTTVLGLGAAHGLFPDDGPLPGAGVKVAVVDSGVHAGSPDLLDVVPGESFTSESDLLDHHGTAVAGLIAGKPRGDQATGIAPGAQIVDVRVYDDSEQPTPPAVDVETDRVAAGLEWVARNAKDERIQVATVALQVGPSRRLAKAIEALRRADVVVVAASGDRPSEETDPLFSTYGELKPGEDAAADVFPAGYDRGVVAVNASAGGHPDELDDFDVRGTVLQSSATDVAAPTYAAVSVGVNGSTCLLSEVATSWAAAEVSGVVALLRARYPDEKAGQIIARLEQTASGSTDDLNVLAGAGVVQPLEALTRPLTPDVGGDLGRGRPEQSVIPPAAAPEPQADTLAPARHDAVWWGLFGGGALVVALLLRPILARRRP